MPLLQETPASEITPQEYELVRRLVYKRSGINLGTNRQHLVQARLAKRIRTGDFSGFRDYFRCLESDPEGDEIGRLIDAISTNTTAFFREPDHFEFLAASLARRLRDECWEQKQYALRIWSAACSSGEEPYTLAMVVHRFLRDYPTVTFKLLATDISHKVLAVAAAGRYDPAKTHSIPDDLRRTYLRPGHDARNHYLEFVPELKRCIAFSPFNLIDPAYPFKYGFDYVLCRNVMIYFDRPTQEGVISRIAEHLRPGGHLIVGHSESLNGLKHPLQYVRPTIYRRK